MIISRRSCNYRSILFLLLLLTLPLRLLAADAARPNILYMMADDHGCNAISAYGGYLSSTFHTPNIDRIAHEGIRLNNCFVTNSICTPSRACILTGQYSQLNGVYTLADHMDPAHENVAKLLQKSGYQTAMIGKWHLQTLPTGFDFFRILVGQGTYFDPMMIEADGRKKHTGYVDDIIADSGLDWLKNRDVNKPFFLMCHFKAPHRSWNPAPRFKDFLKDVTLPEPGNFFDHYETRSDAPKTARQKIENMNEKDLKTKIPPNMDRDAQRKWAYPIFLKDYLRCVAAVDENVGRLLEYLDKNHLADNTIVIYTSDQGAFMGEHGFFDKRFMYEESLRMPFLVRYPREIKAGTTNDNIAINADFAPTFLDYAGQPTPSEMQGRSLRPVLAGNTPAEWRTSMYYRYWMNESLEHGIPAHYGIRTEDYKLIFFYGLPLNTNGSFPQKIPPCWEMYDLKKDPHEMHNVYNDPAYAQKQSELKNQLLELKKQYKDEDEKYPELMKIREKYWN